MRRPVPSPVLLVLVGFLSLGSGCIYSRAVAPVTPDFYTFGPPVEVYWSYGCAIHECGYPSRWAGNRWVYWTGTYWAYEDAGRVYAWTHVRSRPTGVQYTRPRNVVTVSPYNPRPYPPPVQRPPAYQPQYQPSPYTPAPSSPGGQRPKPYQPGQRPRDDDDDRNDRVPPPRGGGRPTPNDPSRPVPGR